MGLGALLAMALGCGGGGGGGGGPQDGGADAPSTADSAVPADTTPTDTTTQDTAPPRDAAPGDATGADGGAAPPNISAALDCGRGGGGSGPGPNNANSLQRMEIDVRAFPDALCNDGSPAVIYFRPYRGEANRNRWLLNLRGGGGCGSGQACAARWCGCGGAALCPSTPSYTYTNFDRGNMISAGAASQAATGIFHRGDPARPNVLGDYNQVRVVYCSSDGWSGTRRAVPLTAVHPVSGAPVAYSIHFLGGRILDAWLATLRQDGGRVPEYTLGATRASLPDLDEAEEVVLAGDSAGGNGVIENLDHVAELLRGRNTRCAAGGACPLVVRGLMDAVVGPDKSRLTVSPTGLLTMLGITTYTQSAEATARGADIVHGARHDTSCAAWHAANRPGTEALCSDNMHVVRHHVTTPFFVRMALRDSLIAGNYFEAGWVDPVLGPFDRMATVFPRVLQPELSAFPMLRASAEEGAQVTTAPGVFAPLCTNHDTINEDSEVFGVTITPTGGAAVRLLDAFDAWRRGAPGSAVLSDPRANATVCPP
ncbi:MAG: hypothetical protein HY909_03055 [Deltaproteobacteria bacterium]|nr:hypothetical protein [Deltaproteobacteria bacterium]